MPSTEDESTSNSLVPQPLSQSQTGKNLIPLKLEEAPNFSNGKQNQHKNETTMATTACIITNNTEPTPIIRTEGITPRLKPEKDKFVAISQISDTTFQTDNSSNAISPKGENILSFWK